MELLLDVEERLPAGTEAEFCYCSLLPGSMSPNSGGDESIVQVTLTRHGTAGSGFHLHPGGQLSSETETVATGDDVPVTGGRVEARSIKSNCPAAGEAGAALVGQKGHIEINWKLTWSQW